jgi:hypothetical protein
VRVAVVVEMEDGAGFDGASAHLLNTFLIFFREIAIFFRTFFFRV